MTAAPPAPQRDIARVWQRAWDIYDRELDIMARRLMAGEPPLKVGERRRLRTLVAGFEQMQGMDPKRAQILAKAYAHVLEAGEYSFLASANATPSHVANTARASMNLIGNFNLVSQQALEAVVRGITGDMATDFQRMTRAARDKMRADLVVAVAQGDSPKDLAKRLKTSMQPTFGSSQTRSITIARTELARAYDLANLEVFQAAAAEGVVRGWEWIAGGKNPCEVCTALNGSVFPVDETPHRHPNCTCDMLPVMYDGPKSRTTFGPKSNRLYVYTTQDGRWSQWRVA